MLSAGQRAVAGPSSRADPVSGQEQAGSTGHHDRHPAGQPVLRWGEATRHHRARQEALHHHVIPAGARSPGGQCGDRYKGSSMPSVYGMPGHRRPRSRQAAVSSGSRSSHPGSTRRIRRAAAGLLAGPDASQSRDRPARLRLGKRARVAGDQGLASAQPRRVPGGLDSQAGQHSSAGTSAVKSVRALVEAEPVPDVCASPAAGDTSVRNDHAGTRACRCRLGWTRRPASWRAQGGSG